MSGKKLQFAVLSRVSTEKQEAKGESLRTQRAENERSVEILNGIIVRAYGGQEHATPGHEKKEIDRLLADAQNGLYEAFMVPNADRWSRDNEKSQSGLELFRKCRIRFFVGTTEYDLFNPEHCLFLGMSAVIGRFQAHHQSRKSIINRIERAKRGIPTCGKLPFGRTFDKASGQWGIDPSKQKMMEDVAKRYLNGTPLPLLAKEYGINHSSLHKTLMQRCGDKWSQVFESKELNISETVEIGIPRLLSEAVIEAVRKRARANRTYLHGHAKNPYLLSSKVFCASCGYAMFGQTNHGNRRYYRHAHTYRVHKCDAMAGGWVQADQLEEVVTRYLFDCFGNPHGIERAIAAATPNSERLVELQQRLLRLESSLAEIEDGRNRILRFVGKGTISEDQAEKSLNELATREQPLRAELSSVANELGCTPGADAVKRLAETVSQQFRRFSSPKQVATKGQLNRCIEEMTWDDRNSLVHTVFGGERFDGKPMGVYVELIRGQKRNKKRTKFHLYGHLIESRGQVPMSGALMDALFTSEDRTDTSNKSALYSPTRAPLERRFPRPGVPLRNATKRWRGGPALRAIIRELSTSCDVSPPPNSDVPFVPTVGIVATPRGASRMFEILVRDLHLHAKCNLCFRWETNRRLSDLQTMSDRRTTYRAVLAEAREAELRVGRRCLLVSIVEESAGGLCASAADAPTFAVGVEGELTTEDGDCLRVEIVHLESGNGMHRIGMRRLNADLRGRRMRPARSTSPLLLLVGITLGLYAGFAFQATPVRACMANVPAISRILYR